MAFIEGQVTVQEKRALRRLGYELEDIGEEMVRLYVDTDLLDIVTGQKWEVKSSLDLENLKPGMQVLWANDVNTMGSEMVTMVESNKDGFCIVDSSMGRIDVLTRELY